MTKVLPVLVAWNRPGNYDGWPCEDVIASSVIGSNMRSTQCAKDRDMRALGSAAFRHTVVLIEDRQKEASSAKGICSNAYYPLQQ